MKKQGVCLAFFLLKWICKGLIVNCLLKLLVYEKTAVNPSLTAFVSKPRPTGQRGFTKHILWRRQ